jgi:pilus assembly protein TadC
VVDKMRIYYILLLIACISVISLIPQTFAAPDYIPPTLTLTEPLESPIKTDSPNITIKYDDPAGINSLSIELIIDGSLDVTRWDAVDYNWDNSTITYKPPKAFAWTNGNHSVQLTIDDKFGNTASEIWYFDVDVPTTISGDTGIDLFSIIFFIMIGTALFFIGLVLYILYLKVTKKFTFEKYFARHPVKKEIFIFYIPILLGFLFCLFSLAYVSITPGLPVFALEYMIVIGIFIAIAPYAIYSLIDRRQTAEYERAFAQMLFEIADAMRGGLDPTKAIIELAQTETGVLRKHLKIAADNLRLGRPFEHIMQSIARPIKSDLVRRYSSLIANTSKVGGETAAVIHRAAKDMDDFIKVGNERRRQLFSQASIIYVAFFVLLIMLYMLITFFPEIGSVNFSLLSNPNLETIEGEAVENTRIGIVTIKQRFLDLLIINSIGTGTIIGSFIDGNIRFGLIHSLILTATSTIFFFVMIA